MQSSELGKFSNALSELVQSTARGVVAVKSASHRVTSGVALSDDLVAVASHSLRRNERVSIYGAERGPVEAAVLGRDGRIDLAILKAEGLKLQPLSGADPASLKAGMLAVLVGSTLDAGTTATLGMLGAVGPARQIWRGGALDQFLRIDARVYPSQSGAAAVTAEGLLIGMATPALSRHSVLALPLSTISRVAKELSEQGRLRYGYLGVGVQPVVLRDANEGGQQSGLIVLSVEPGSPAEQSGVLVGDVLLSLNGKRMADIDDLHGALSGEAVGKAVTLGLSRAGSNLDVLVTIIERRARG